jgi:hypothetical protein
MAHKTNIKNVFRVVLLGLIPLLAYACGPAAVTQSEQQTRSVRQADITPLIGAQKVAPPPTASGPPPRSPHTTPPSYYEPVGPFFFYVETLTSVNTTKYGVAATVPCIQSGVFKRGMRIVFRYEILDVSTGKRITDKDGATTKVRLQHGEELTARWAIRGSAAALPDSAWMWDTSWDIPPDYPVGSLDYAITVSTKDGRTGTFIPPIQKTLTSDTRVRIID